MSKTSANPSSSHRNTRIPDCARLRIAAIALSILAFLLSLSSGVQAQVVMDPTTLEFDPSPDHSGTLPNGNFMVQRYDLEFYLTGAEQPFQTSSLGKPMPQPDGKIRLPLASVLTSWPGPTFVYEARVSAVGVNGIGLSEPSNPFGFSAPCSYTISPALSDWLATGGIGTVSVETGGGCTWSATTSNTWISVSNGNGMGIASFAYTVAPNTATTSRTGVLIIAGQTFTVTQAAASCTYSLSPTSQSFTATGGTGSMAVTAGAGCAWTASTSAAWITLGATSGSGAGSVSLTVAANTVTASRTATVTVAGQTFTVTEAAAQPPSTSAPTITTFTPAIGPPGTAVTITGTNFDTAAANNQVKFNVRPAAALSSSTTSVATSVPTQATSGRISLTTAAGTVVSAGDFFVPPAPYTALNIAFTGRVGFGVSQNVFIGEAAKIGLVLFDGVAGQRISIALSAGPVGPVTILKPDGSVLGGGSIGIMPSLIEGLTLTSTGTHTIVIDPAASNVGTVTLTVHDIPGDVTKTIVPGGAAVGVTLSIPGQNGLVTFNGAAGQRGSLRISAGPIGVVSMLNPDGTLLASASVGIVSAFLDTRTLPTTGVYTILVNPTSSNTGTVTLTLYDVPADVTRTILIGGPAVSATIGIPGQNGAFTFAGTVGRVVTVRITGNSMSTLSVKLLRPDGTTLTSSTSMLASFNLASQTLPVAGTYVVSIDPAQANIGTISVTVSSP